MATAKQKLRKTAVRIAFPPDSKRSAQAERILAATYRVLTKQGFSELSMGKIADEAKVNKRMLHYYFDTKERLVQEMTRSLGGMLLAQIEEAIAGVEEPDELAAAGFDRAWQVISQNRELLAAYFSLASAAVYDERLREVLHEMKDRFRALIQREVERLAETGRYEFTLAPAIGTEMIVATVQGFALEFIERGETPELLAAFEGFKTLVPTFVQIKG